MTPAAALLFLVAGLQADPKKAVEEFRARIKEASNLQQKALAVQQLGDFEPRDPSLVGPLASHLAAQGADLNFVLPVAAAAALGKFRGVAQASHALLNALGPYKNNGYVRPRLFQAIGQVGHDSAMAMLVELLRSETSDSLLAVQTLGEFPATAAMETFFREYDWIDKKKAGAQGNAKKAYDRTHAQILSQIRRLSGEKYLTIVEFRIWWQRRGAAFREEAAKMEKDRKAVPAGSTVAPPMIVELEFRENGGATTANSGSSGVAFPSAAVAKPSWSATAPPNGDPSALDWGKASSSDAVDLGGPAPFDHLKNLASFTIAGWMNCSAADGEGPSDKVAGAGNRIVSWINPVKTLEGVELVCRTDGSLQLGINQWADASAARSSPALVPVLDESQPNALRANWRFFAVTYDSTVGSGHVKFYFSPRGADVKLDKAVDCDRGPSGGKIAPHVTVGNVSPLIRATAPDRSFRGMLDEVRVFGSGSGGSGALPVEELIKLQDRLPRAP